MELDVAHWQPFVGPATDLTWPVRLDPHGIDGPTRGQARGRRWRHCAHGWHVPAAIDSTRVEQRILEQAVRLRDRGAVTGWAGLRWRGANYFTGRDFDDDPIPVTLITGYGAGRSSEALLERSQLAPRDWSWVCGIRCASPARAAFDQLRFRTGVREGVVDLDMVLAAGLMTWEEFAAYVATRTAWTGVPQVRVILALARPDSRSPQETRLRLVWELDAELPPPVCNKPVFDLSGNLIGIPDLLDPVAGLVAEYDGAAHKERERHRRDVARSERFRRHRLECVEVVGGDLQDRGLVVDRLRAGRARALFLPPEERAWTLKPPAWWVDRCHR